MNQGLDSPGCLLYNKKTSQIDLSNGNNLFKLHFTATSFDRFPLFQSISLKQFTYIKSNCVNIQGYLNVDSYIAINYLVQVCECIKIQQKNTILIISQLHGLLWTSLTNKVCFFQGVKKQKLLAPKQILVTKSIDNTLKNKSKLGQILVLGKPTHI